MQIFMRCRSSAIQPKKISNRNKWIRDKASHWEYQYSILINSRRPISKRRSWEEHGKVQKCYPCVLLKCSAFTFHFTGRYYLKWFLLYCTTSGKPVSSGRFWSWLGSLLSSAERQHWTACQLHPLRAQHSIKWCSDN